MNGEFLSIETAQKIVRLEKENKQYEKIICVFDKEVNRLFNIVKEAINYINEHSEFMFRKAERRIFDGKLEYVDGVKVFTGSLTELLDILKEVRWMIVNYKEIFKLKVMLDNEKIPYEFLDRSLCLDNALSKPFYQIIIYKKINKMMKKIG